MGSSDKYTRYDQFPCIYRYSPCIDRWCVLRKLMWRNALPQVTVLIGMLTTLVYSAACFDRWLPLHCVCQHHTPQRVPTSHSTAYVTITLHCACQHHTPLRVSTSHSTAYVTCACQRHTYCHLVPGLFLPSLFFCCSVLGCFTCIFWGVLRACFGVFYVHVLGCFSGPM